MALTLGDNFSYQGAKPLDGRLKYDTVAAMKAMADSILYDGCLAYCVATDKTYQWKSTNTVDETLGRWREFGSTVDSAISSTSENPVQSKVIHDALDNKADLVNGKVPAAQLPAYVDDVIEGYYKEADDRFYVESTYEILIAPESGKSWVDISTNKSYRWTGDRYVRVDEGVQLGETADTAYRGDRGKVAYDISQTVGDIANLNTTEKSSVIGAINEVQNFNNLVNRPVKEVTSIQDIISPLPVDTDSAWEEKYNMLWYKGEPILGLTSINIYVNPQIGVNDIDNGYGFSLNKPFATIEYALKWTPADMVKDSVNNKHSVSMYISGIHRQGSTTFGAYNFNFPNYRMMLIVSDETTIYNAKFIVKGSQDFMLRLNGNLVFNIDMTLTSHANCLDLYTSFITFDVGDNTAHSITITGNTSSQTYLSGLNIASCCNLTVASDNLITLSFNNVNIAVVGSGGGANAYVGQLSGSNIKIGINVYRGGTITYRSNTMTATTAKATSNGGRIYTGSQS